MLKMILCYTLVALVATVPSSALKADSSQSKILSENAASVKKTWHGEWQMNTDVDWTRFSKIQLEQASVTFRKHWARDQRNRTGNRPTKKDIERVKTDLSKQLNEVFIRELTKNDAYVMTADSGENVMRITPKIVDLDVYAPDKMRNHIGYSMTDSKGNMTLELEIHDSQSGALLAAVHQFAEDRQKGWFEWTTYGTNKRAAGFMLSRWGNDLREWLIEARSRPRGQ